MNQTSAPIPAQLYSAEATRSIDRIAIEKYGMPGYSLMSKAGEAVFDLLQQSYPLARRVLVCCGAGNNGGDGYVVARLAKKAGMDVTVINMVDPERLQGDARQAYRDWKALGIQLSRFEPGLLDQQDVVIDALLGTGLQGPVEGAWLDLIEQINGHDVPVIAVDIPSGLAADTGNIMGIAIQATMTVSFIAMKKGMLTHQGVDCCGELHFNDLDVPADIYGQVPAEASVLRWPVLKSELQPRKKSSHKGDYGHVLVVGGDYGMGGAVRMAAEAALRTGAGLVSVVTRAEHVGALLAARPELMVRGVDGSIPPHLVRRADCIVIGPGLGRNDWGNRLLGQVLQAHCPRVLDADALHLLAADDGPRDNWVLTPHPGEAARLLGETTAQVQQDRYQAVYRLQQMYGGTVLLKGAGSIVQSAGALPGVCVHGNPGMASGGMGDVLSGIIGGLIAQGFAPDAATRLGTAIHAGAGDLAARAGQRGLLATDLYPFIRKLVNPEILAENVL